MFDTACLCLFLCDRARVVCAGSVLKTAAFQVGLPLSIHVAPSLFACPGCQSFSISFPPAPSLPSRAGLASIVFVFA